MKHERRTVDARRRVRLVLLLAVSLSTLAGFARASETEQAAPPGPAQDAPALADPKERLSYALGMILGKQFRDQSIQVDPDAYLRGLKGGLSGGKTLLTEPEARAVVKALQGELKKEQAARKAASALPPGIAVSFKVDPRLTKSLYMGDRWVSPPTYTSTVQEGKEITVEARAEERDAKGKTMKIQAEWTPSDPEMVTVTPPQGNEVRITVQRAGKSTLKVAAPGLSKELSIKATAEGNTIRVEITQ
jgi:hypothetical protein